ncbi:MAG TPA: glycolate oxidase subunit GlcE, partial [Thiobacillus sp.]|nr:glycolate oxidase subunit GlcE [Thiobacillus sp.]
REAVRAAFSAGTPLAIRGGGTKRFYTGSATGTPLDVTGHRGIVSYEPTELVITARAGTPLAEIEATLAADNQMLGFEPPHFTDGIEARGARQGGPGSASSPAATLGGTIACGFSGPRRPYAGSARDFVLGTKIINGKGEVVKFGGQVMKNVAGFDVSRLMAGSLGTLGVLLEISLKVLPKPAQEITLTFQMGADEAIRQMNTWAGQPLPLSAAAYSGDTLYIRLSGSAAGVRAARTKLGGELLEKGATFWEELREHQQSYFKTDTPLWRLSVPPAAAPIDLPGNWLLDWGGAQRWLVTNAAAENIHRMVESAGGYATLFRTSQANAARNSELPEPARILQKNIKLSMDPAGILNPG